MALRFVKVPMELVIVYPESVEPEVAIFATARAIMGSIMTVVGVQVQGSRTEDLSLSDLQAMEVEAHANGETVLFY